MAKCKTKGSKDHDIEFKTKIINEYYEYNRLFAWPIKKLRIFVKRH
ncbi:MAG: hypothetical protein OHM56_12715 [Spiroplasma phoeniceum]|nr:MAG: hypothetical protein OHM57_12150 [Spiroplasma phoeniceum]UZQ32360.1 MAG: hypothetical protein OHM56_12715 [Spiroplasma phoeniceum]